MTVTEDKRRLSGDTPAQEVAADEVAQLDEPVAPKVPAETSTFNFDVGFSRIRTEWKAGDLDTVDRVRKTVSEVLVKEFWDLYAMLYFFYENVRTPLTKPDGEIVLDEYGLTAWERYPKGHPMEGLYVEDWGRLGREQMRDFLLKLNANLFRWRERTEHLRTEALYAKSEYEGAFARGFESLPQDPSRARLPTERDREQRAKRSSEEERLFALYQGSLSRQADALVKSVEKLEQRLIDVLKLPA